MFKQQELILAQQTARLAIWEWSADTDEVNWLPGSTPLFGYPPEQLRTEADIQRCIFPEDRERVMQARGEAVRDGSEYSAEYRVVWPNGEIHWLRARGRGVEHPERGRLLLGAVQDITEEKKREEQLRGQAQLLELAHEPILVRDREDRITYWNKGAERLYGYTWQEAKGHIYYHLLQTRLPLPISEIHSRLRETDTWEGEVTHVTKYGRTLKVASRWQRLQSDPTAILETNFDLSQQHALQLALVWQEKARLLADISHEINNPLTIALGAVHLLKTEPAESQRFLSMLEDAIQRIAEFIRHSNALHRAAQGTRKEFEIVS